MIDPSIIRSIKFQVITLMMILVSSCIEPYSPEVSKYEDMLVIDGRITNLPEYSVVKLSRSFHYSDSKSRPEQEATVFIKDDQENVMSLYETSPGVYRFSDDDPAGIIGGNYQLFVITADQERYESDVVELKKVPEIENLYAEFGLNPDEKDNQYGFQIYIDAYDPEDNTRYYRYNYLETWEFEVPYPSKYLLEDRQIVPRNEDVSRCWKTNPSTEILIHTNERMESNSIRKFPIKFVSVESSRLSVRYSILVRQYSLNRESYLFWDQLKKSNQEMGTLFDAQPMQIKGNVYNTDNPESPVLGYFDATAVSSRRIFIKRTDVPTGIRVKTEFDYCKNYYSIVTSRTITRNIYKNYCIIEQASTAQIIMGWGVVTNPMCCDCTISGSKTRPDFW